MVLRRSIAARRTEGPATTLRRALATLALAALACGSGAQGLVQGVLGLALSPAPGQAPALQVQGGVALRLEQVQLQGRSWQHLLASDGRHGWTAQPLGDERPVSARAQRDGLELLPVPPGHVDFLSAVGQPVPAGATGRLLGTNGTTSVALADDDSLSITRLEEVDLDGDGLPEWVLEVAGLYGDGYYTELWVVDGRNTPGPPRVQRQALSRSSGETPASAQDAAWAIGSDRTLWVWRSAAKGSRLSALRYGRGGLTAAAGQAPALVLLGDDNSAVAAQQRRLQVLATAPGAVVLPRQTAAGLRWITAIPTASAAQAGRWAAEHAMPAVSVRRLPWPPS